MVAGWRLVERAPVPRAARVGEGYLLGMAGDSAQVVWMPGGNRSEIQLTGEDTAGAFCLLVDEPPAGWSLPAHRHRNEAETIHVVEGHFEIVLDGVRSELTAGQTIHVPRGAVHSSANIGERAGRRVLLFSPAGMERFFAEAGAPTADSDLEPAETLACATRHGWEFMPAR
jgi:quercetin dioxygenase-like cupin family protein